MVISLIVTGVAFSIYRLNASYYLREDAALRQYQNLRVALYTIGRDVRMAGNGFALLGPNLKLIQAWSPTREVTNSPPTPPTSMVSSVGWFRNSDTSTLGVRAIYGVDGGANFPDTLTVFRAEVETGTPLAKVKDLTSNEVQLDDTDSIPEKSIKPGDIIALVEGQTGVILQSGDILFAGGETSVIPVKQGGRFTAPTSYIKAALDVSAAYLYNFRDVGMITYWVDTATNSLMAAYHDTDRTDFADLAGTSSIVADNIEDLQVYYYLRDDTVDFAQTSAAPDMSSNRLDSDAGKVKAVSLGLTSRSSYGDGNNTRRRPALFNRSLGTNLDDRQRTTLIETIFLRNFHT
jgi:hypothetical protein